MLPIHEKAPSSWAYKNNVNSPTENWNVGYTDADLLTGSRFGNGAYVWCQEFGNSDVYRLIRGSYDVSISGAYHRTVKNASYGWRPVLELVD